VCVPKILAAEWSVSAAVMLWLGRDELHWGLELGAESEASSAMAGAFASSLLWRGSVGRVSGVGFWGP